MSEIRPIRWVNGELLLLDQTRLPAEERIVAVHRYEEAAAAIREMRVRGAPAIGVTAAYALAMAARDLPQTGRPAFLDALAAAAEHIGAARPTAVNLRWALDRLLHKAQSIPDVAAIPPALLAEADAVRQEDEAVNRRMGEWGRELLSGARSVLTHCNTGALATSGYGTALGVIRAAWESGQRFAVFNTETRPWLQGARLTSWEFRQLGIPATLVVDSAAGMLLQQGRVDCVITGADRVAANGDAANKIGTYSLAVLAHENRIPFYIAAPTSTIDLNLPDGAAIQIEERAPEEITRFQGVPTAPEGVAAYNPSFDVTPCRYISGIVTEAGIARPPFLDSLRQAVEREQFVKEPAL